jgi:hypothetical protein
MKKNKHITLKDVRKMLVELGKETHYLLDKPIDSWDEYDWGNYHSIAYVYELPLKKVSTDKLLEEIAKRIGGAPGILVGLKKIIEDYENS